MENSNMRNGMKSDLLSFIPSLRAFAFCITQDHFRADELLLSSLIETWSSHVGKNGLALRIAAFNTVRRQFLRQVIADPISVPAFRQFPANGDAFRARFTRLPRTEREAISLIEVWGFDPSQAAEICDCDRETINRRINMARIHLTARSPHLISNSTFKDDTAAAQASAA
jgi:RNA polymerase sigma-70 factor (ECF subfamily)